MKCGCLRKVPGCSESFWPFLSPSYIIYKMVQEHLGLERLTL